MSIGYFLDCVTVRMAGTLLVILLGAYPIVSANGLFSNQVCGVGGLTLGGRVVLPEQDGGTHLLDGGRKFVFVSPTSGRSMNRHGRRGRIWVTTRGSCDTPAVKGYCPVNEPFPCIDSIEPCLIGPPRFRDRSPLTFSDARSDRVTVQIPPWNDEAGAGEGPVTAWKLWCRSEVEEFQNFTKVIADLSQQIPLQSGVSYRMRVALVDQAGEQGPPSEWQTFTAPCFAAEVNTSSSNSKYSRLVVVLEAPDQGGCTMRNYTLKLQQLDRGGCPSNDSDLVSETHNGGPAALQYHKRKLDPNSLFNVTITVRTLAKGEYSVSEEIRTQMTAPTGIPVVHPAVSKDDGIIFSWSRIPCSARNSDRISYEYVLQTERGTSMTGTAEEGPTETGSDMWVRFRSLDAGETYRFRVRAVSTYGSGEYSAPVVVTF